MLNTRGCLCYGKDAGILIWKGCVGIVNGLVICAAYRARPHLNPPDPSSLGLYPKDELCVSVNRSHLSGRQGLRTLQVYYNCYQETFFQGRTVLKYA